MRTSLLVGIALVAAFVVTAIACDDDNAGDDAATATAPANTAMPTVQEAVPPADDAADGAVGGDTGGEMEDGGRPRVEAPTATPTPSPEIAPVTIEASPDNPPYARLLSGSATMTENDAGGTDISVTVRGIDYEVLGAVVASVREGTCEIPGEVNVELPRHQTDIGEDVTVNTTIDDPPYSDWLEVPHHMAVYDLRGETRFACGNILAVAG